MALNFRKFLEGIKIVPKISSTISELGDFDVTSGDGKLNYHNGSSASPVVTEAHSATLTNKTLTTPIVNTSITGGLGSDLSLSSASSQKLNLSAPSSSIILNNKTSFTRTSITIPGFTFTLSAPTTTFVDITSIGGSSALQMINATGVIDGQVLILTNRTGVSFTIYNLLGGTAAWQIVTSKGIDITFNDSMSLIFIYNSTASKWYLVGEVDAGTKAITTKSSSYALNNTDSVILVSAPSYDSVIELPAPFSGKEFTIKRTDSSSNLVKIAPNPKAISISSNIITVINHGLSNGMLVQFYAPTGNTLPTGISANTTYYVVGVTGPNTFQISDVPSGNALAISGGSGISKVTTSTIDGQPIYLLQYKYDSVTLISDGMNFFIE